jgi:beta-barrel assembly-enhancing protease
VPSHQTPYAAEPILISIHKVPRKVLVTLLSVALVLAPMQLAWGERTHLSPSWTVFSQQEEAAFGQEAARQVGESGRLINDKRVDDYVNQLGQKLAAHSPGYKYNYQYKVVNDRAINAFALPAGYVYVNRGLIEAVTDEAQLAAVLAHETAHIALRHGTAQVTKTYAWQFPLDVFCATLGGYSLGGLLVQVGAGLTIGTILLGNSRRDESEADVLGTQILFDSGYDPRAMAQFFEKIEADPRMNESFQFFSDHPSPANRIERVNEEVTKLGGPPRNYQSDSNEFEGIKSYLNQLPRPPRSRRFGDDSEPEGRPVPPSDESTIYRGATIELSYPDNWQAGGKGDSFTLYPEGGVVPDELDQAALAYGVIVDTTPEKTQVPLQDATNNLIQTLRQSNPGLKLQRPGETMRVDGSPALSTYLSNESPLGGPETDWLITISRPGGLLYIICAAPDSDYPAYQGAFQSVVTSVHFRQ